MIEKGQKVRLKYRHNEDVRGGEYYGCEVVLIPCEVMDVCLEDHYFHEKDEPMWFKINLKPLDESIDPNPEDYEKYNNVLLEDILKYHE